MTNEMFNVDAEMYNARLAHYNEWMARKFAPNSEMDICAVYPGFPSNYTLPVKADKKVAEKTFAIRVSAGATKLEQAKALFRANSDLSRAEIIALFMDELGMSKAGATTYWYNAQKWGINESNRQPVQLRRMDRRDRPCPGILEHVLCCDHPILGVVSRDRAPDHQVSVRSIVKAKKHTRTDVAEILSLFIDVARAKYGADAYAYAAGYMSSTLSRLIADMSAEKQEEILRQFTNQLGKDR